MPGCSCKCPSSTFDSDVSIAIKLQATGEKKAARVVPAQISDHLPQRLCDALFSLDWRAQYDGLELTELAIPPAHHCYPPTQDAARQRPRQDPLAVRRGRGHRAEALLGTGHGFEPTDVASLAAVSRSGGLRESHQGAQIRLRGRQPQFTRLLGHRGSTAHRDDGLHSDELVQAGVARTDDTKKCC